MTSPIFLFSVCMVWTNLGTGGDHYGLRGHGSKLDDYVDCWTSICLIEICTGKTTNMCIARFPDGTGKFDPICLCTSYRLQHQGTVKPIACSVEMLDRLHPTPRRGHFASGWAAAYTKHSGQRSLPVKCMRAAARMGTGWDRGSRDTMTAAADAAAERSWRLHSGIFLKCTFVNDHPEENDLVALEKTASQRGGA